MTYVQRDYLIEPSCCLSAFSESEPIHVTAIGVHANRFIVNTFRDGSMQARLHMDACNWVMPIETH